MSTTIQQPTQRIRGQKLEVFIPRSQGLPFDEGIAKADKENRVIVSSKRLTTSLIGSNEWIEIKEAFACWSGTMTAYVEPNIELGASATLLKDLGEFPKLDKQYQYAVVSIDSNTGYNWIHPIPERYLGIKNGILVIEHPDYNLDIEGQNRLVVPVSMEAVDLVANFPATNGYYLPDPKYDIPQGNKIEDSLQAKRLLRIDKRVGSVRRDYEHPDFLNDIRQEIFLNLSPLYYCGMVTEACSNEPVTISFSYI
ncbi:MAG: hypothetical protein AABX38_07825 [Candidatus Micrarchaeota archaeon]